jgi:hypothetical protein
MNSTWLIRRYGRLPMRPALAALAGLSVLSDAAFFLSTAPFAWATDARRNLAAAQALLDGTFGAVDGYLYSPVAAALTIPALAVPEEFAIVGWLGLKLTVVVLATLWVARALDPVDRVLACIAVAGFLPVVHDLELGNVTVLVAASIALIAWFPDRLVNGAILGIILATAPKPAAIPLLLWMVFYRPRALAGSVVVGSLLMLATFVIVGTAPFVAWIGALQASPNLVGGNFSLSGLPSGAAIVLSIAIILATVVAARRGPVPGLLAALCCGLLVSPYTILYAGAVLLVVVPATARVAPGSTYALAILAPFGLIIAFPLWVACALLVSLAVVPERWGTRVVDTFLTTGLRPASDVGSPP